MSKRVAFKLKTQSGQGLLELILALAIFGMYAASLGTMVLGGFRALEQGGEHTQALAIAQEGIEAARSIKNRAWNEIQFAQSDVEISGNSWNFSGEGTTVIIDQFTRTILFSEVCRDSSNVIVTCPGTYTDPHTKLATVRVEWQVASGATNRVTQTTFLSNWESSDWTQTNWSGGNGQTIWSNPSRFASTDGNINTSIPGQISLDGITASCTGQTWTFDQASDYDYDSQKIAVTSSRAQLIAGLPINTHEINYNTPADYTYNPSEIEVSGGVAQLYGLPPSGSTEWNFDTPGNYSYSPQKIEVTGGVGRLAYLGAGSITEPVLTSLEFDPSDGDESDIINISGDVYAIAYNGPGADGHIQTVSITNNGTTITPLTNFEYNNSNGREPDIFHVSGNVYAIAYRGDGSDGFVRTVNISSNGTSISGINNYEFDNSSGYEPSVIRLSGNIFAIAYRGAGNDGYVHTLSISSNGTTITGVQRYEFDNSQAVDPHIINVSGTVYAIVYEGPGGDGFIQTVNIATNGSTISNIQRYEFETVDANKPFIRLISGSVYAVAYRGPSTQGYVKTINIPSSGTSMTTISTFLFESGSAYTPYFFPIVNSIYGIAYEGPDTDGFLKTLTIPANGNGLSVIDTYEYDQSEGRTQSVIPIGNYMYAIAYSGPGSDGYLSTIHISPSDYATDRPTIQPTSSYTNSNVSQWTSFTESATKNGGQIYYQLSNTNGSTWLYWNGSSWTTAGSTNYNTASVVQTQIATFPITNQQILFRAFLESNGSQQVILDSIEIGYANSISGYPTNNPSITVNAGLNISELNEWSGFAETATKNGGEIYYQLSNNNGTTWYYWNGSNWVTAIGPTNFNTANQVSTAISDYPFEQLSVRAFLQSNGIQLVQLDTIQITYTLQGPDADTVGLWHLNESTGDFVDNSGNSNSLTVTGPPTYSQPGVFGSSVYFDGNNDYAEINDASQNGLDITGPLTIDLWFYRVVDTNSYIVRKWTSGSDQSYRLFVLSDGSLGFQVHNGGNIGSIYSPSGTITSGQVYHVAAVYDGTSLRLFVNGNSVTAPVNHPFGISNGAAPFQISSDSSLSFYGYIDEVRVSSTARWTSNFTPPTSQYGDNGSFPTDHPTISPTSAYSPSSVDVWNGFNETATKNGGEIFYQLSDDGGLTWQFYNGIQWASAASPTDYNTATEIHAAIASFPTNNSSIMFKAFLESDGNQQIQLDEISIDCGNLQMEIGSVSTDEQWTTINLQHTYTNPVIVASYYESANSLPASVRLQNIDADSFEIRLQHPSGANLESDLITYFVIEEGIWTIDGALIEAHTYDTSTVGSWTGWNYDVQSFQHSFSTAPIVLHQVQTNNDTNWITSYINQNGSITNPPGTSDFGIGLNGAEVTSSHGSETIGWIAIEPGITGSFEGVDFETVQTPDSVLGHDDGCYTFNYQQSYPSEPLILGFQQEMDGANGGWSVQCSNSPTQVGFHSEEDQEIDSERNHTTETFAYIAFSQALDYSSGSTGGFPTSGELVSSAFNTSNASRVQVVEWDQDISSCASCAVQFQIQTAPDAAGVPGAWTSTWSGPDGDDGDETDFYSEPDGELIHLDHNFDQWIRYRVTLTGDGSTTPILEEVRVNYK